MPRLSHVQQEALHQLRQVASRPLFPEQLGTLLLEALRKAIHSDVHMLLGVDPTSRLFNRLLALEERHASGFWHWLEHIYLVREPNMGITFPGLMQAQLTAAVIHDRIETSWGVPPDLFHPLSAREVYRGYHEIDAPAGGILRAVFAVDGHYVADLQMLRLEAHPYRSGVRPSDGLSVRNCRKDTTYHITVKISHCTLLEPFNLAVSKLTASHMLSPLDHYSFKLLIAWTGEKLVATVLRAPIFFLGISSLR